MVAVEERVKVAVDKRVRGTGLVVMTERVKRLREEGRIAHIQADSERIAAFTAVFKETDGKSVALRRALALRRYLETCTPVIFEGELIVGSSSRFRMGAHPFLEYVSDVCEDLLEHGTFTIRRQNEEGTIAAKDKEAIAESAAYWAGRSTVDLIRQEWHEILGDDFFLALHKARLGKMIDGSPPNTKSADYPRVFAKGFHGLIVEAREELSKLDYTQLDALERRWMLEAMIISLEGMINFASRYGETARQLAQKEHDAKRRAELLRIAENCKWVPGNPPRSFSEALQFFWFVHLGLHLEVVGSNEQPGRMDQYLYPYYLRDIESGHISKDEAAEYLACLWVKFNDINKWALNEQQEHAQGSQQQYVTIGGVTREGEDATNELSYLILEVARQVKLRQPGVAVRWHKKMNTDFLLKAIETNVDLGGGIPSFVNDDNVIPNLMSHGISLEDARNWAAMGCVHVFVPGKQVSAGRTSPSPVKIFEIALNNGVDPVTGLRLGIETGDPRNFTSAEELEEAFKKQYEYWTRRFWIATNIALRVKAEKDVLPFISAVQVDCISKGKDILSGSVGYPQLMFGFNIRGWQNIANSLAAIKKVVFDDKKATMEQVLDAIEHNFEGYESLRQMLIAAPKWGNDDDYVDEIHARLWKWGGEFTRHEARLPWGETTVERGGATFHYFAGKTIGATPDGRKAFELLADGTVSAAYGTDKKGATAVVNSALKLDQTASISNLFNLKFSAGLLRDDENRRKLLGLVETYFKGGGFHVQFNIVDGEALRRAKNHPEEYRDLMVRIAGFSVYFVELPSVVQDEIIARTEYGL